MSTDLTPERKLCDWIDANGIVMQGATPSMLLSAAGLDALTARAEAAEKKVAAVREVHKPVPVYTTEAGDCEHDGDCEAVEISAGSYCPVYTDGLTCNECAELAEHADDLPAYPCPTITALDTHTPETETTP